MVNPFLIQPKNQEVVTKNRNIKVIRSYGGILLIVLFFMHSMAFVAFRFVERNAIRTELQEYAKQVSVQGLDEQANEIYQFPDGIIVLHSNTPHGEKGFYEIQIGYKEFFVYARPGSNILVAKSEHVLQFELIKVAFIISILYITEVILFLSWWFFLRDRIFHLFLPN